jgi:O-antigen/teichoic acid export membrane protein
MGRRPDPGANVSVVTMLTDADHAGRRRRSTSFGVVASGALWNIGGRLAPLIVAFATIPMLVRALGVERWSVFTLGLAIVNLFMLLDLGLGRCVTRRFAEATAHGHVREASDAAWSGVLLLLVIGAVVSAVGAASVGEIVSVMRMPPQLMGEAAVALRIVLIAGPLSLVGGVLWGILPVLQMLRVANLINVPLVALYYVAPLIALHIRNDLALAMWTLVGIRALMVLAAGVICVRAMPSLLRWPSLRLAEVKPMLALGGWISTTNVLAAALAYTDRFVIGAVVSIAALGYYATPLDLVIRITTVPACLCATLLPALSASLVVLPSSTGSLIRRSLVAVAAILLPTCGFLSVFAREFMVAWLGHDFALHSAGVLAVLAIGIVFEGMGMIPGTFVDALGRSRLSAQFMALLVAAYLPVLYFGVRTFGIEGAAIAWAVRAAVDCGGLFLIMARLSRDIAGAVARCFALLLFGAALIVVSWAIPSPELRMAWWAASMALIGIGAWTQVLAAEERTWLLAMVRKTSRRLRLGGFGG